MLGAVVVLALLVLLPGALLLAALGRSPRGPLERTEDAFHAAALSLALLVLVGSVLGHVGLYRFAATGAPLVEACILALVAGLGAVALRRRAAARAARPSRAPQGGAE